MQDTNTNTYYDWLLTASLFLNLDYWMSAKLHWKNLKDVSHFSKRSIILLATTSPRNPAACCHSKLDICKSRPFRSLSFREGQLFPPNPIISNKRLSSNSSCMPRRACLFFLLCLLLPSFSDYLARIIFGKKLNVSKPITKITGFKI